MNTLNKDMSPTPVYVLTGTEHEDINSPQSPYQGRALAKYFKDGDGNWISVGRDQTGKPHLGYLAKEITELEAATWERRILGAASNREEGFRDSEGLWYPGNIPRSVITATAHKKSRDKSKGDYFSTVGLDKIDALADSITAPAEIRSVEYSARLEEAQEFLSSGSAKGKETEKEYKFLATLRHKGLDLESAANLVIANAEQAKDRSAQIAELRMRKNLLLTEISGEEKNIIYNEIIESLNSLR